MTQPKARESELLPCPFCGGEAAVERVRGAGVTLVHCKSDRQCGSVVNSTKALTIAAWNTRPSPALPAGDVEGVREALECGLEWVIDAANNTKGIELENAMRDIARIEAVLASLPRGEETNDGR